MSVDYEFDYTDDNFQSLRRLAKEITGVTLLDTKKEMVFSRVSRILRKYKIQSFDDYCLMLETNDEIMKMEFVSAITTHLTFFMREKHHFEFLKEVISTLIKKGQDKIRIWSAGCSSGEEPYCIGYVISEAVDTLFSTVDCKILATDIDNVIVNKARTGVYNEESVSQLSGDEILSIFDHKDDVYSVKDKIKNLIHFKLFNLMDKQWPMQGPFDVIFCRNVLIYFDREKQGELISHFASYLSPGGYLILGHSESIPAEVTNLKFLGKTIYQRIS